MRESFGGAFMIKLVLVFIVIYISFMAVAIDYAKVFRVKNNVINILEQNQFLMKSDDSVITEKVDPYLRKVPYNENDNGSVASNCGVTNFGSKQLTEDGPGSKYLTQYGVCIEQLGSNADIYYKVTAYIAIDFPFFGLSFTLPISGETKIISI